MGADPKLNSAPVSTASQHGGALSSDKGRQHALNNSLLYRGSTLATGFDSAALLKKSSPGESLSVAEPKEASTEFQHASSPTVHLSWANETKKELPLCGASLSGPSLALSSKLLTENRLIAKTMETVPGLSGVVQQPSALSGSAVAASRLAGLKSTVQPNGGQMLQRDNRWAVGSSSSSGSLTGALVTRACLLDSAAKTKVAGTLQSAKSLTATQGPTLQSSLLLTSSALLSGSSATKTTSSTVSSLPLTSSLSLSCSAAHRNLASSPYTSSICTSRLLGSAPSSGASALRSTILSDASRIASASVATSVAATGSLLENRRLTGGSAVAAAGVVGKPGLLPVAVSAKGQEDADGRQVVSDGSKKKQPTGDPLPQYHLDLDGLESANDVGYYAYPPVKADRAVSADNSTDNESKLKKELVNWVCASLLRGPDFKQVKDGTRLKLVQLCKSVSEFDPEFILKLALYTRTELNIRTTANFLLAYAAYDAQCRPHVARYFCATIQLPSDWIEVAEIYQAFHDDHLSFGSLPVALRKAMVARFKDFDEYQLAKYNKEKSRLKKQKLAKTKSKKLPDRGSDSEPERPSGKQDIRKSTSRGTSHSAVSSDAEDSAEETLNQEGATSAAESDKEQKLFTLKQLIRQLHIYEPVYNVMCLLGKRYPSSSEEFYKSRLPGLWEESKAGKRMKLAIPETWETQVSLKGNRAPVWQELIDRKKLPFMAMLRNLRNMLLAGISEHHHQWVIGKLTDEMSVINSKQFPFRFFSAYEVLNTLEAQYSSLEIMKEEYTKECLKLGEMKASSLTKSSSDKSNSAARHKRPALIRGRGLANARIQRLEKDMQRLTSYNPNLLQRYRNALDTAVKISTVHNVDPVEGRTLVLCKVGSSMFKPCTAAKGLGAPRQVVEVAILLALMCKYSCEQCTLIAYTASSHMTVELEKGTILKNIESVMDYAKVFHEDVYEDSGSVSGHSEVSSILTNYVVNREQLDNLIILWDGEDADDHDVLADFLSKYRHLVNPDLLHVSINLSSRSQGLDSSKCVAHPNDVYLSGYSDQLLRFIAKRADGQGQIEHIEAIDKRLKLAAKDTGKQKMDFNEVSGREPVTPNRPMVLHSLKPRWRSAKVFISSTFRDMHGERDLLTRFVIPEIRARAAKHYINVFDVDLRWGVTEEVSRSDHMLEICLTEASQCQFFIGLLGERYGWRPTRYNLPSGQLSEWVHSLPAGLSVTELEMRLALRGAKENIFFFIRDKSFMKSIPKKYRRDFFPEDNEAKSRMAALKNRIRQSGCEVYDGYPCTWMGTVGGLAMVGGLEELGKQVMTQLWQSIRQCYPDQDILIDEFAHQSAQHDAAVEHYCIKFTGRADILKICLDAVTTVNNPPVSSRSASNQAARSGRLVILTGPAGCGLSSIMAKLVREYQTAADRPTEHLLVHFVGVAPGSANTGVILRRFCHELAVSLSKEDPEPEDFRSLVTNFHALLTETASRNPRSLVAVFVDGLDLLEDAHMERSLSWIPLAIPENVAVIVSARDGSSVHSRLERLKQAGDGGRNICYIKVPALDLTDKKRIVTTNLAAYRKTLSDSPFNNQLQMLTSKKDAGNAMYLSIACEELRLHGDFEKLTEKIRELPQLLPALIQNVLSRLEEDVGCHGLLSAALCFLLCARDGLADADLLGVLSYWNMFRESSATIDIKTIRNVYLDGEDYLPATLFARVCTALRVLLKPTESKNSGLLHYVLHREAIADAVRERYKMTAATMSTFRRFLAGHFWNEADYDRDGSWKGRSATAFAQLPYQLALGDCIHEVVIILTDLRYLKARFYMGLAASLLQDYSLVEDLAADPSVSQVSFKIHNKPSAGKKCLETPDVEDYKSFVSRNVHILSRSPAAIMQQALNEPATSAVAQQAAKLLTVWREDAMDHMAEPLSVATNATSGIIQWLSKPLVEGACYRTIVGQHGAGTVSGSVTNIVSALAISSTGSLVAAGDRNGAVRVYNMKTAEELQELTGHSGCITRICFVAGNRLCSAAADGVLCLWNIEGSYRIAVMNGHSRSVSGCVADSTGKVIVSVGRDCCIKLWNGHSGKFVLQLTRDQCPLNAVAFHPEGQQIATGCWDATIKIWDTFSKARKAVIRGHRSSVRDVAFSPNGKYIASASLDGEVKLWAADKGIPVGNFIGHRLFVTNLTFSTSGLNLLTAGADHKVKVWSAPLGLLSVHHVQAEHGSATAVTLEPTASYLLSGYMDGTVVVYDLVAEAITATKRIHAGAVRRICPCTQSQDNGIFEFITCSEDGTLLVNSFSRSDVRDTWSVMHIALETPVSTGSVLSISSVGILLASTTSESRTRVHIWRKPAQKPRHLVGHVGAVTCCCFTSDASRLATGGRDCSVIVWDTEAASRLLASDYGSLQSARIDKLHVIQGCHADWVNDLAWSSDASFLVTASNDFNLKLWDTSNYEERQIFKGHTAAVNCVSYAHGCIVSGSSDGQVKIWTHRGSEVTTLYVDGSARVNSCSILLRRRSDAQQSTQHNDDDFQDANTAAGIEDCSIQLHQQPKSWATRVELTEWWTAHKSKLPAAAGGTATGAEVVAGARHLKQPPLATPGEQLLVCCSSDDGSVKLWLPLVGHQVDTYDGHSDRVVALACCPASHQPAGRDMVCCSSSSDGSMKFWGRRLATTKAAMNDKGAADARGMWGPLQLHHQGELVFCIAHGSPTFIITASREDAMMCLWQYEDGVVQYASKVTLHSSPTCACFIGSNAFVTSCTDGETSSLTVWRIALDPGSNKYLAVAQSTLVLPSPVSALACDMKGRLCAGLWSGRLSYFGVGNDHVLSPVGDCAADGDAEPRRREEGLRGGQWPVRLVPLSKQSLLLLGSESLLTTAAWQDCKPPMPEQVRLDAATYMDAFGRPVWFTAAAAVDDSVWIGDSNGQVTVLLFDTNIVEQLRTQPKTVRKVHGASISAIARIGIRVLTASFDMTVKVWTSDLEQIGEFHIGSPITVLQVIPDNSGIFVVGDRMGSLNVLKWFE